MNIPACANREQILSWQAKRRAEFINHLIFPTDKELIIDSSSAPIKKAAFSQYEFAVKKDSRSLFRFFRLVPNSASEDLKLPAIICFMGHGKIEQLLSESGSYQQAAAAKFAEKGYLVYAMENAGMMPERDTHLELDRELRQRGLSWYSLLFAHQKILLDHVFSDDKIDVSKVGTAGVSTGGLLALSAAATDPRVAAASVHGIFGSMAHNFIVDGQRHCSCGAISGLLAEYDLPHLAVMVAPRPLHISNSKQDSFSPKEAKRQIERIVPMFLRVGGKPPYFTAPEGSHEFALKEAIDFFAVALLRSR